MAGNNKDLELIEQFLNGDKTAFRKINVMIDCCLYTWKNRLGSQTEDVRGDTLLELYQALQKGQFRFQSGLKSFVYRITNNNCIDNSRYTRVFSEDDEVKLPIPTGFLTPEEKLEHKQLGRINFRVIRQMSVECRQLWRMNIQKGLKYREIAELFGVTEGNIRRKFWACREIARKWREKILKKDKLF
ncbi:MAG: RNA polymerase sigma factor [Candidatus Zixiibacteriota bacterium]